MHLRLSLDQLRRLSPRHHQNNQRLPAGLSRPTDRSTFSLGTPSDPDSSLASDLSPPSTSLRSLQQKLIPKSALLNPLQHLLLLQALPSLSMSRLLPFPCRVQASLPQRPLHLRHRLPRHQHHQRRSITTRLISSSSSRTTSSRSLALTRCCAPRSQSRSRR